MSSICCIGNVQFLGMSAIFFVNGCEIEKLQMFRLPYNLHFYGTSLEKGPAGTMAKRFTFESQCKFYSGIFRQQQQHYADYSHFLLLLLLVFVLNIHT